MLALTSPAWKLLLAVGFLLLSVAPAEAARHEVKIEQYAYGPSSMSITQGDTVTWTNLDSVEHDVVVTSGPESFRSPLLSKGQSWSHTFTTPGSYSYICSLHPDMRASVTAAAAEVAAPPTTAAAAPTATPHPEQSAASVPSAPPSTGKRTPKPTPSATATAQPAVTTSVPAETATTTLNPLLFVAGAAIAVVVFCLLLMAARPAYEQPPTPPSDDDE